ncbi:MAG: hypothetical protein LW834_13280 [Cyanobium sp. 49614_E6]|nr:hypothetical protein [Cyanobium sp. 49614_E6]
MCARGWAGANWPSPETFLNAYLAERYGLEVERPWASQELPLTGAVAPDVPGLPVPELPE